MKSILKFLSIIFFSIFIFINPASIFAEYNLKEADKIQYFKINETHALQVLEGRKGEQDRISVVEYEKNSNLKSFYQHVCIAQFIVKDNLLNFESPVYYDKGIFFNDSQFFDASVGSAFDAKVYGEFGTTTIQDKIKEKNLHKNNELTIKVIRSNFPEADIQKTGDLGCFMVPFLMVVIGVPGGFLLAITVIAIKIYKRKN